MQILDRNITQCTRTMCGHTCTVYTTSASADHHFNFRLGKSSLNNDDFRTINALYILKAVKLHSMMCEDYLEGQELVLSAGLPPFGAAGTKVEPSRKKKVQSKSDACDMLRLAARNAFHCPHSQSCEKVSFLSMSPYQHLSSDASPQEIILKQRSETDLQAIGDYRYEVEAVEADDRICIKCDASPDLVNSRGSSFDFDSGISSLTSVSIASVKSIIQLNHSASLHGLTLSQLTHGRSSDQIAEVHTRLDINAEFIDDHDAAMEAADEMEEGHNSWNLTSIPSRIIESVRLQRRRSDSEPSILSARSLSSMLFRRRGSRICPDPHVQEMSGNNQIEEEASETESRAHKKNNFAVHRLSI